MKRKTLRKKSYGLDQFTDDCVTLRRKLGIPGGALTKEQEEIYLKAKDELWRDKFPHTLSGGPEPRPKPKS